jgi:hypothetical protein
MRTKIHLILFCLIGVLVHHGFANESDSLLNQKSIIAFDNLALLSVWERVNTPAAYGYIPFLVLGNVQGGYNISKENIRWAQSPGKTNKYFVETAGLKRIGKAMFRGSFAYNNYQYYNLKYNNTLEFDNKSIYIIGDTINGHQKKEGFSMFGGFSLPVSQSVQLGFKANYDVYNGAKTIDPRNENKMSSLELTPGFIFRFGRNTLGISGGPIWRNNSMDIDVMFDVNHNLFKFLGMGYYKIENNITSYYALYEDKGYNASIQLGTTRKNYAILHAITYSTSTMETRIGTYYRLLSGITNFTKIEYQGALQIKGSIIQQDMSIHLTSEKYKGTEIEQGVKTDINQRDSVYTKFWINDKHINQQLSGNAEYRISGFNHKLPLKYQFTAGINGYYNKCSHYPIAEYGYYKTLTVEGYINYRHFFGLPVAVVSPKLGLRYRKPFSHEMQYLPIANKSFTEIVETDYCYLRVGYLAVEGELTFLFPVKNQFVNEYYLRMQGSYLYTPDLDKNNNNYSIALTAGITF